MTDYKTTIQPDLSNPSHNIFNPNLGRIWGGPVMPRRVRHVLVDRPGPSSTPPLSHKKLTLGASLRTVTHSLSLCPLLSLSDFDPIHSNIELHNHSGSDIEYGEELALRIALERSKVHTSKNSGSGASPQLMRRRGGGRQGSRLPVRVSSGKTMQSVPASRHLLPPQPAPPRGQ